MAYSESKTVDDYIKSLPKERGDIIKTIREKIKRTLPDGIVETMNWGMICYEIPLEDYPDTYNKKPLMYGALSAQKNHYAIYSSAVYSDKKSLNDVLDAFSEMGIKPNMGKSCIRFTKLNKIPLDTIIKTMNGLSKETFIALYEASRKKSK